MWRNLIGAGALCALVLMAIPGVGAAVTVVGPDPGGPAAAPVDLLTGLRDGLVVAQFRGAGGSSVSGTLGAAGAEPLQLRIPSGTQFLAQLPGRQGMSALGSVNLNLAPGQLAQVVIPTACTALGLPEPTPEDIMIPFPCPDARLARVAAVLDQYLVAQPVAQLAVWAISDNPPVQLVQPYLMEQAPGLDRDSYAQRQGLLENAAGLLAAAGLPVEAFRMFTGRR